MLKTTLLLFMAAAASADKHKTCGICPVGQTMKTKPETIKLKACLANDAFVDAQCYACMKKAFSRTYPIYPECLNCNYTNGTEVFCQSTGKCGIASSTTCADQKDRVTERAKCPATTDSESYSWCPEIMGEAECSDAYTGEPMKSFQCDEGEPVASSSSSWAKCPRKPDAHKKDPECAGCLNQHRDAYERKVDSCYKCFKDGATDKIWCPDDSAKKGQCVSATASCFNSAASLKTCPNNMDKKYNTTGTPGLVPEVDYGYCADVMGEPWCQKNPTDSFQCDEGNPVLGKTSAGCPNIAYKTMWDPATLVKTQAKCSMGPSAMEDTNCDEIQKKIKTWTGDACMKDELADQFSTTCCEVMKKNVTSTGGSVNTMSHTVLAAAGLAAFLV